MIEAKERKRVQKNMRRFLLLLLLAAFIVVCRLLSLQVIDRTELESRNFNQVKTNRTLQSPRGTIFDRNGHPLAMSMVTRSLYADPKMIKEDPATIADAIAPYVRIKKEEIIERLQEDTAFVCLDRMMDPDKSRAVADVLDNEKIEGLNFVEENRRFYPNGNLLAQVLGFVGTDDKGLDGLEMVLDKEIKGARTKELVATDSRGNPILGSIMSKYIPDKERSVTLTIDTTAQFIAERALDKAMKETKASGASIIIMDPKTGEIIAMANRPTYDPNEYEKGTEEDFKNRAVTNIYEPGSTFKPIIASAALASGKWTTETVFHDTGHIMASGHVMQNWNGEGYGDVRLLEILKFSINTGMARIGLTTGPAILLDYIKAFGFGKQTGIDLPGEGEGLLFTLESMSDIDTAAMSIGQGIAVTPLQMVQAFGALANGGHMVQPHIIKSIDNPDGTVYEKKETVEVGQPIPEGVAKQIVAILEKEVSEGGGHKAYVEGYHFGGKTGTAEKLDPENGGYLKGRYIASFIGFGPIEDPRFVALIVIDDPGGTFYGGQIAAPVFKDIMSQLVRYYQISPSVSKEKKGKAPAKVERPTVQTNGDGQIILPDFTGWSTGEVRDWLHEAGLSFVPEGTGYAISQEQVSGEAVDPGSAVRVYFKR